MRLVDEQSVSGSGLVAALIIFVLPLASAALQGVAVSLPSWMINHLLILFLGSFICSLVLAMIRSLPRWSFSYLGLILTIFVFLWFAVGAMGLLFYPTWMQIFGPMGSWFLPVRILY